MTEIHLYILDIGRLGKRRVYGKEILRRFPCFKICETTKIIHSGIEKNYPINKYRKIEKHKKMMINV